MSQLVTDGKPITIEGLPDALEAFELEGGETALWDPARKHHVNCGIAPNIETLGAALTNLGFSDCALARRGFALWESQRR